MNTSSAGSRDAYRFILFLGMVSLFADATYESARSILGQFLASLGATAMSVGAIAGLGELLSNGLRVFSGHIADLTRRPWRVTLFGFGLNMIAVPLLALAATPTVVAALVFTERTGKAIRNPPRDAMLSGAARRVGDGRGFGMQEALGQIGAVVGPLLIAALVARGLGYRFALALLAIPAVVTMAVLLVTRSRFPHPGRLEPPIAPVGGDAIPGLFWVFVIAAGLIGAGYLDFALIAFSLAIDGPDQPGHIPTLYALAMGMQAAGALGSGQLFDRYPTTTLTLASALGLPVAALVFGGGKSDVIAAMVLWGLGQGAQKTVFKATIAKLVPQARRATAYGLFFGVYGFTWFMGSVLMGHLHDTRVGMLITFSVASEMLALPLIVIVGRGMRPAT